MMNMPLSAVRRDARIDFSVDIIAI